MIRLPRAALAAVPLAGLLGHRREPSPQCEGAATFLAGSVLGLAVGFAAGRSLDEAKVDQLRAALAVRGAAPAPPPPPPPPPLRALAPMPLAMLRNALRSQVIEDRVQFDDAKLKVQFVKALRLCGTQLGARVAASGYERADEPLALSVDRVRARRAARQLCVREGPRPARRRALRRRRRRRVGGRGGRRRRRAAAAARAGSSRADAARRPRPRPRPCSR